MFHKSTWLHLRIPFSFFLLPVFLFAVSISPNLNPDRLLIVFVVLHLFIYPASNGYNSYFDRDENSIGGLKNPPKVRKELYFTALIFDVIGILLALQVNLTFAVMVFIYGLVSKAYSHPSIRLKKYAWISWFIAGLFQGFFTFLMAYAGINDFDSSVILQSKTLMPAMLSSLILWGSYPMTQIYQHEEDIKRGDRTLSYVLGIRGTFHFTAIFFTMAVGAYFLYFSQFFAVRYGWQFILALLPVLIYFIYWYVQVRRSATAADYTHTMRLNFISALCLNAFFIYFFLDHTHVLQAIRAGY
ncbi:UbiA family prenyltransferase [Fulvivirga sedimenti]|uniref:UbiA family prenyltransferase n=1 Tax=Fulvivirga sedimenti TaxID=2879465 RepID=A0A9X1HWL7_9BACT|nr:UbiA family prenyltransferase [Fulvivirga sedimenti]MCA6078398.1 UbiA family prenyltransferase [Fulvivirga sedimenti]